MPSLYPKHSCQSWGVPRTLPTPLLSFTYCSLMSSDAACWSLLGIEMLRDMLRTQSLSLDSSRLGAGRGDVPYPQKLPALSVVIRLSCEMMWELYWVT